MCRKKMSNNTEEACHIMQRILVKIFFFKKLLLKMLMKIYLKKIHNKNKFCIKHSIEIYIIDFKYIIKISIGLLAFEKRCNRYYM